MFINRYLAAFARGHGGKITVTCFLQLILTLLGTMISLGVAFVVRMQQGEARILFFSELWQVLAAIGICIALRYALSREKMLAAEQCSLGIKASLRDGLLRKLFALGPAYTGRERTGNIASTISSKVESWRQTCRCAAQALPSFNMRAAKSLLSGSATWTTAEAGPAMAKYSPPSAAS